MPEPIFFKRAKLVRGESISLIGRAVGAAWATFIASVISGSAGFAVAQRHYRIGWEYGKLLLMLLAFLAIVVASVTLEALEVDYWIRLPEKLIAVGVFIYIGIKVRVLTRENMMLIRDSLLPRGATST